MNGDTPNTSYEIGSSLGGKISRLVANASVHSRQKMAPHTANLAQKVLADFTNHVSDEVRSVLGPLWKQILADPGTPAEIKPLVRALAEERGQAWAWIGGTAAGAAMAGGLINLLTNAMNPAILTMIAASPHGVLAPDQAAAIEVRRMARKFEPRFDANAQGIDNDRYDALLRLNRALPTVDQTWDLLNRGNMSSEQGRAILRSYGYSDEHIDAMMLLRVPMLSPETLAQMWNRSIVDTETGAAEAKRHGMSAKDFLRLTELFGEPLSPQDLLTALRRGIINEEQARRGWVQGPVRNEWFPVAVDLQYSPMSTVDAADSVNQGHLSLAEGRKVAEWNGLVPEHFDTLIENAGLPPGVELATEAWNRGLLSDDEYTQTFLESRLKNRYVELYKKLRYRVVPQETVRRLYRIGQLTRDEAAERLKWNGFDEVSREALLAGEDGEQVEATRELNKTEILALYTDGAVTEVQATEWLADLGYGAEVAGWEIALANMRKARRYVDAVLARVRAGYVGYRLDMPRAASLMDSLRITPDQREQYITLWDLEREAVTRGLTPAQITAALKKSQIDQDGALRRMREQGYSDEDARILLNLPLGA